MSRDEWQKKLHLSYAGELRSMAEKMRGAQSRAMLNSIAEDHEQAAKALENTATGDPKRETGTAG
jgi:hypothetical protein